MSSNDTNLRCNQSIFSYTTLGVGPVAEHLLKIESIDQAVHAMRFIHQRNLPNVILGKGSNVLFSGTYFKGIVLINKINFLEKQRNILKVGAGYSFSYLGQKLVKSGDERWYFAMGIPGSVGGAVVMNAGSLGFEFSQFIEEVEVVLPCGTLKKYLMDDNDWGYRKSPFHRSGEMIVSVTINLEKCTLKMTDGLNKYKKKISTQPYDQKTAGCVFKNPETIPAGKLIEEIGLKGFNLARVGVSSQHANFLVNHSQATYQEVELLIAYIKKKALEEKGIALEEEVVRVHF